MRKLAYRGSQGSQLFGSRLPTRYQAENAFGLNGVGNTLVQAIFNRDYPVVQATTLFVAAIFVIANLSVDLLYGYLDPRIKQG